MRLVLYARDTRCTRLQPIYSVSIAYCNVQDSFGLASTFSGWFINSLILHVMLFPREILTYWFGDIKFGEIWSYRVVR